MDDLEVKSGVDAGPGTRVHHSIKAGSAGLAGLVSGPASVFKSVWWVFTGFVGIVWFRLRRVFVCVCVLAAFLNFLQQVSSL